jgi:hypothetical protein
VVVNLVVDVVVVVGPDEVDVVVVVGPPAVVDVVVVVGVIIFKFIEFVQVPVEATLMYVAASGTLLNVYPETNADLATPLTNGVTKSTLENKLNGPVSAPGDVSVTKTTIEFYI